MYDHSVNRKHLSKLTLTLMLDGELGVFRRFSARIHLSHCWRCQAALEKLRAAAFAVVRSRNFWINQAQAQSSAQRAKFREGLANTQVKGYFLNSVLPLKSQSQFRTSFLQCFAGVGVIAFVALTLYFLVPSRHSSNITTVEFFRRAASPTLINSKYISNGVVHQELRIAVNNHEFRQSVYRDLTGKHHQKLPCLDCLAGISDTQAVIARLNWQEPLSGASFVQWHSEQSSATDVIDRDDKGSITMTTTVKNAPVIKQTLTVSESTFHPVARTITFSNESTITIAELSYDVLNLSELKDGLLEPSLSEQSHVPLPLPAQVTPYEVLTFSDLDGAELQVRLRLNRIGADRGEQIQLVRTSQGISIFGVVDSEDRRQEIERSVKRVRFVTTRISGPKSRSGSQASAIPTSIAETLSAITGTSGIQHLLDEEARRSNDVAMISQELFDSSSAIALESKAIADLSFRFDHGTSLAGISKQAYSSLITSHENRLRMAIQRERASLLRIGLADGDQHSVIHTADPEVYLLSEAEQNLKLCKQLILPSTVIPDSDPQATRSALGNNLHAIESQVSLIRPQ